MSSYILAHDLGTTGNKATLYDLSGNLCASALYEYNTFFPKHNWVEQDPEDWWKGVCISTRELLDKAAINKKEIACISFSAQMMGCLPVDKSGAALRKSIIWADQRATKEAKFMEDTLSMERVYKITGHRISPSYSAAKLLWVKENEASIYKNTYKILHAKDYIIHKLTGKFLTDYSDASGMNLFDIRGKVWSKDILFQLGIEEGLMPEAHPSTDIAGGLLKQASLALGLLEGTPVVIGGGDGSCAAVGAGVVEEGRTYNVIGSSSWIAIASKEPIYDKDMRTFNWVHLDPELYSPCGTMQTAGYSLNWLKNTLCELETIQGKERGINTYKIIDEEIIKSPPGANNLLFLPYLIGERSPRWNPDAKGALVGLKMTSTKSDMYRSVLEGVGYNLKVIMDVFNEEMPLKEVIVIGGGAKSKVWLQILADIWQKNILVPKFLEEATSMGAAICGGVGIKAFPDFKVINKFNKIDYEIFPRLEYKERYDKLFKLFNDTYEALIPIYRKL
ncbi:MAG TPA: xylulokinase [Clostridiaceae bacterium]